MCSDVTGNLPVFKTFVGKNMPETFVYEKNVDNRRGCSNNHYKLWYNKKIYHITDSVNDPDDDENYIYIVYVNSMPIWTSDTKCPWNVLTLVGIYEYDLKQKNFKF